MQQHWSTRRECSLPAVAAVLAAMAAAPAAAVPDVANRISNTGSSKSTKALKEQASGTIRQNQGQNKDGKAAGSSGWQRPIPKGRNTQEQPAMHVCSYPTQTSSIRQAPKRERCEMIANRQACMLLRRQAQWRQRRRRTAKAGGMMTGEGLPVIAEAATTSARLVSRGEGVAPSTRKPTTFTGGEALLSAAFFMRPLPACLLLWTCTRWMSTCEAIGTRGNPQCRGRGAVLGPCAVEELSGRQASTN